MTCRIKVIVGSVRPGRQGKGIADWIIRQAGEIDTKNNYELVDLKDVNLPFLDEPVPPRMSDDYVHEHTKKWSEMMKESDGLIIVSPEYNYGYSPVLKNAIDYLYKEWQEMPVALVGYGGAGGTKAIRQLREVLAVVGMKVLEYQVTISEIWNAIDDNGNVKSANIQGDIKELFQRLETLLQKS